MDPEPHLDTERHAAELLELGEAFLELDRDWRIVRVNRRQEALARRPREETLGRTFGDVWPELATPTSRYWREYRRCMEERVAVQFDEYYAPLDLWTAVTAHPVSGGGIAIFFRDITDRRRGVEALRRSEDQLRIAHERLRIQVESSPLALVEWDADYRVTGYSQRAEELFGWAPAEVLGKRIDEIPWIPEQDWPVVREVMRDMSSGARPTNVNANRNVRRDGRIISCEWYNSTLRDEGGRLVSVLSLVLDVTEREEAVAALREANERLREADRRKDEFLGMLSHELRNPLAPIRNALYILDHAAPTGEQARRAKEVASRQITHLTRLVDDLLDITRIARGKIELRRTELDLCAIALRTADDYRAVMVDRGLKLVVDVPRERVDVNGDETRLAQVLGNLLSNAAKFTPEGGRVTLAVRAQGDRAHVHVRDTGVGIAPEVLPTIFEPFTQGRQTLARSEGGLGLGLSLVKGLVALHGGDVTAVSGGSEGGTDFVVTLPLAHGAPASAAAASGRSDEAATARRRVLVVDDNRDAADTLAQLVALLGHEVAVAYDASAALARASEQFPDVVLCDLGLPDLDGFELGRRLRALSPDRPLRLVALSGYAQPEDVSRSIEAGFDAHVAKPPDPGRLGALLA